MTYELYNISLDEFMKVSDFDPKYIVIYLEDKPTWKKSIIIAYPAYIEESGTPFEHFFVDLVHIGSIYLTDIIYCLIRDDFSVGQKNKKTVKYQDDFEVEYKNEIDNIIELID